MADVHDGQQHVHEAGEGTSDGPLSSTRFRLNEAEIEVQLGSAQHTIQSLHSRYSNLWDSSAIVVSEYLRAVNEVADSIAILESKPLRHGSRSRDLFDQAQAVQQIAMERLEKELMHILEQNKHCLEHDEVASSPDESTYVSSSGRSSSVGTEACAMDFIHADTIPHIQSIANVMYAAGFGQEFCRVFTAFWRETLGDYLLADSLTMIDMEHARTEDVLQMNWKTLTSCIREWCRIMRRFTGVYLVSVKVLFDQVLGEQGDASSDCLIEASKLCFFHLLRFGQAVSIGPHRPKWLCFLLDMYEVSLALIPDMDSLFPEESDSSSNSRSLIRMEFHDLLTGLGDSAKVIFEEMGNDIRLCHSTTPHPNGGIPPLTKYLMNYILTIAEYGDTLNSLLQTNNHENSATEHDVPCTVGAHLQSWTTILEANLDDRGELYNYAPLKHIFMMNNILYMVRKISKSKINPYFGDDWIRSHMVKCRQHAVSYERFTWGPILPLLHDDGKIGKALKAKCREFASAFEDLYKNQTRWCVPDVEVREELRIFAAKTVIPAYRSFAKRVSDCIGEKHIKYSEKELEKYILDLLEGSPKSL